MGIKQLWHYAASWTEPEKGLAHPMHFLDVYTLHVRIELQNQLLQEEERPLVSNMLPYLQVGTLMLSAVNAFT